MVRQGVGTRCQRKARPGVKSRCHCEKASESSMCCRKRASNGVDALPQGSPKEGKHECECETLRQSEREVPPRRDPNDGALPTWDPGGK